MMLIIRLHIELTLRMREAILLSPRGAHLLLQTNFFFLLGDGTVMSTGLLTHTKGKITKVLRKALRFSAV
jgi:hypothetical protein